MHVCGQASLGIKAGVGFAGIKDSLAGENALAWEAGFFSSAEISDHFSLQPEIDYSEKGGKLVYQDTSRTIVLQNAGFRVLALYQFNDHFSAGLGPYFTYMFNARQTKVIVPKSWYSPFGVGFNLAAQAQVRSVIFSLRYDVGLTLLTRDVDPEIAAQYNPMKGSHLRGLSFVVCVGLGE